MRYIALDADPTTKAVTENYDKEKKYRPILVQASWSEEASRTYGTPFQSIVTCDVVIRKDT